MIKIYKITNTFLNPPKSYVGRTNKSLEKRFEEHFRLGRKGINRELCSDLIKYGKINFNIELLEESDCFNSNEIEDFYIRELKTHYKDGYGYNMRYEDISQSPKIQNWESSDLEMKQKNIKMGVVWNKGIEMEKYISDKIKTSISKKKNDGWINPSWGRNHSDETKKKISEHKKEYYLNNRPHNSMEWIIEYESGQIEKTNNLIQTLGGKKEYNRITKWCRTNPNKYHPKLKMRVYHV